MSFPACTLFDNYEGAKDSKVVCILPELFVASIQHKHTLLKMVYLLCSQHLLLHRQGFWTFQYCHPQQKLLQLVSHILGSWTSQFCQHLHVMNHVIN